MKRLSIACCAALALLLCTFLSDAHAQQVRPAKLLLTVVDQTGAVIPNAVVTLTRTDDPAKTVIGPVKSNEAGLATVEALTPANYDIQAEFPGFQARVMKNIRLRAGDNKQVAILTIQNLQVFKILPEENCILVRGAIPGAPNDYVVVTKAATRTVYKRKGMGKEEVRSKNPLKASKKAAAGR